MKEKPNTEEARQRYTITKTGTHWVSLEYLNQDWETPGSLVCESGYLYQHPGKMRPPWGSDADDRKRIASEIREARQQGWRFARVRPFVRVSP